LFGHSFADPFRFPSRERCAKTCGIVTRRDDAPHHAASRRRLEQRTADSIDNPVRLRPCRSDF